MKLFHIALIFLFFYSSCSSYRATVKKYDKLSYEKLRVHPEWKYKNPSGAKWITPVIGLSAGAFYGYQNQFSYEEETYTGVRSAAIWGGIGLITGAIINGVIFPKRPLRAKKFELAQRDKWLKSYNKQTGNKYAIYEIEPKNTLILVPENRLGYLEEIKNAELQKDIARLQAEEDRIKIEQENRRKRQQEKLTNEEKLRNIVKHLSWEPITITGEKEVYPSALITSTTYAGTQTIKETKNLSNYIGFYFNPEVYGASSLNYEIEATDNRFVAKSSGTIELNGKGKIFPDINWIVEDLVNNKETRPLKVTFRIKDQAGNYQEKILDLAILSINECILSINGKKTYWILPAYVNEQSPLIDEVLKEALDKGYVDAWTGYQLGENAVFQQVEAIWKVLSDRKIRYSSITGAGNVSRKKIFSQYIRTVSDALKSEQANCIDGTLLFASILKRIELDPYIVLYPGHANLAFDVYSKNKKTKFYLEITTLPNTNFEQAIIKGFQTFSEYNLSDITELDINLARKSGIKPFGW